MLCCKQGHGHIAVSEANSDTLEECAILWIYLLASVLSLNNLMIKSRMSYSEYLCAVPMIAKGSASNAYVSEAYKSLRQEKWRASASPKTSVYFLLTCAHYPQAIFANSHTLTRLFEFKVL